MPNIMRKTINLSAEHLHILENGHTLRIKVGKVPLTIKRDDLVKPKKGVKIKKKECSCHITETN